MKTVDTFCFLQKFSLLKHYLLVFLLTNSRWIFLTQLLQVAASQGVCHFQAAPACANVSPPFSLHPPPPRSTLLRTSASCSPRLAMIFWQKTRSQPCYTTTANSWRSTSQQRKLRPSSACSGGTVSRGLLWLDWGP